MIYSHMEVNLCNLYATLHFVIVLWLLSDFILSSPPVVLEPMAFYSLSNDESEGMREGEVVSLQYLSYEGLNQKRVYQYMGAGHLSNSDVRAAPRDDSCNEIRIP